MASQPIDYTALAQQAGAISSQPAQSVDYTALAKQAGAISSIPSSSVQPPIGGNAAGTQAALAQKYPQYYGDQPGPIHRFLSGAWDAATGLWKTAAGTPQLSDMATGTLQGDYPKVAQAASEYLAGPGARLTKSMYDAQANEASQAKQYWNQGRYSEAAGHGAAAVIPGIGPAAADIAETAVGEPPSPNQVGPTRQPNVAGALGKSIVLGGTAAMGAPEDSVVGRTLQPVKDLAGEYATATGKMLFPVDWHDSLMRGIKPGNSNLRFPSDLYRAVPEMKAVEPTTGPIVDVDSALAAAQAAKRNVWSQYEQAAGPARAMNTQVDLTPVAKARVGTISPKLEFENPEQAQAIRDSADVYRTSVPLATAESFLATTNAELKGYYAKFPLAQRQALASDPYVAQLNAEAEALRDSIYKSIDPEGEGAAPAELKRRYGALMNVEDQLQRRSIVAARQQPNSLTEQFGNVAAGMQAVRGIAKATVGHNPIGGLVDVGGAIAAKSAAKYMKEQQTSDALIRKAFANYDGGPPHPVMVNPPPITAGLLGPGAIRMPGPDASGPVPFEPRPGAGLSQNTGARTLGPSTAPYNVNGVVVPDITGALTRDANTLANTPQLPPAQFNGRITQPPVRRGGVSRQLAPPPAGQPPINLLPTGPGTFGPAANPNAYGRDVPRPMPNPMSQRLNTGEIPGNMSITDILRNRQRTIADALADAVLRGQKPNQ